MQISVKRLRSRIRTKAYYYFRCGAKTATFIFWATLYMVVMKMTVFKTSANIPVRDWSMTPDNYTKWQLQGPVVGSDEAEADNTNQWQEPDNETLNDLERRADRIRNVCHKRSLASQMINNKEFFIDYKHNIVWCNIFKAASSFWLYKFNILGGYDRKFLARTRHTPLTLARKKFPRPSVEELHETVNTPGVITLIVVREPFVRLLSAYRDKLENTTPPYYRKLARSIVAEYRDRSTKIFGSIKTSGPTFYEFVIYLIEKYNSSDENFTFDEHWAPYYKFCTPCAVNFSVIGKVETLSRDSSYVIQQLGLGHVLGRTDGDKRTRLRTVMNKSRDGKNTMALMRYYFGQLDHKLLDGLLQIYGIDFEMFGYDSIVYRSYVRK